jgi:hypothetical protein
MARTDTKARSTFLVEHYRPGLTADELSAWAARVRETAGEMESEGKAVRYVRSTIVPTDEALLCTFEAESEQLVREAYARAGIPFERITPVIPDSARAEWPQPTKEEK